MTYSRDITARSEITGRLAWTRDLRSQESLVSMRRAAPDLKILFAALLP